MEKNNTYSNTLVSMKYSLGNSTNCYVFILLKLKDTQKDTRFASNLRK